MIVFGISIPYFKAYLMHYLYNSIPKGDRKKTDFGFGISIKN